MAAPWDNLSERLNIYRNTQDGWIAGVCAGIADRLAVKPVWVRVAFVLIGLVLHGFIGIILYFVLAFLLKPRAGATASASPAGVQMAYRDFTASMAPPFGATPSGQIAALKSRFAALDARLNAIEAAVMTDELSLRRKFKDLGG